MTVDGAAGVATSCAPATDAAVSVLRRGGNAVDAAVAAAFALAVCEPSGSGLGGQASMLVAVAGQPVLAVDGHSRAPMAVTRRDVRRRDQISGYRACTVPTLTAVLGLAQARWGTLAWPATLEPAIVLAEDGYRLTRIARRQLGWAAGVLARDPYAARTFLPTGRIPKLGSTIRQPRLATTLRRLAHDGAHDFYTGRLARDIVRGMGEAGGLLTAEDLAAAAAPRVRPTLRCTRGSAVIDTLPAPGGGLVLLVALQALADQHISAPPGASALLPALATRAAHGARDAAAEHPADDGSDLDTLLADAIKRCATDRTWPLNPAGRATGPVDHEPPGDTTHLSVADGTGMMVSLTSSIQSLFGAKVTAGELGFFWNNYLRTCPRRPGPYRLAPGCLPRSNAAPTIVSHPGGAPYLAVGAAGSRRITSSLVQVLSGILDTDASLTAAVCAPRVHATKREAWVEKALLAEVAPTALPVRPRHDHDYTMGAVQGVARHPDGSVEAVADPRRAGLAWSGVPLGSGFP